MAYTQNLTPQQALQKIKQYCAYQERSHYETKNKLFEFGLKPKEVDDIIATLIEENFLNEERFACAFATGKFRMKKWGRQKIENELKLRKVSSYCINTAMALIENSEYEKTLRTVMMKKWKGTKGIQVYQRKIKTAQYLISRGYESDLVWKALKEVGDEA